MQKVDSPLGRWGYVVLFLVALLAVAADQLSKMWVRSYPEGLLIYEIGFLRVRSIHNTGAAFGLFQGQSFALTIIALLGIVVFLVLAVFFHRRFPLLASIPNRIAIGFLIGGTVGNLIDRIRLGYITDFIDFPVWPAFNVADSCIVIGVIIFAFSLLRSAITENF